MTLSEHSGCKHFLHLFITASAVSGLLANARVLNTKSAPTFLMQLIPTSTTLASVEVVTGLC